MDKINTLHHFWFCLLPFTCHEKILIDNVFLFPWQSTSKYICCIWIFVSLVLIRWFTMSWSFYGSLGRWENLKSNCFIPLIWCFPVLSCKVPSRTGCLVSKTVGEAYTILKSSRVLKLCNWMTHIWGGALFEYFWPEQIISGCILLNCEASICHSSSLRFTFIHRCERKCLLDKAQGSRETIVWTLMESCLNSNNLFNLTVFHFPLLQNDDIPDALQRLIH